MDGIVIRIKNLCDKYWKEKGKEPTVILLGSEEKWELLGEFERRREVVSTKKHLGFTCVCLFEIPVIEITRGNLLLVGDLIGEE